MADEKPDQASVAFAQPSSRQLTEQFSHPQRTVQPDFAQADFTAPDTSRPELLWDGSGEASDSMGDGNVPKARFNYWDHEVWEDNPANTAPVEPTRESLKKELNRAQINEGLVYGPTDSLSVEPVQDAPHGDITSTLQTDVIPNHEAFADVALEESNAKNVTKEQEPDKPNMTSHFSVSEFDPDEAAERASIASVSSASEDEAFNFEDPDATAPVPQTKEEVQEPKSPEQRESGGSSESDGSRSIIIQFPAPEIVIVAPEPSNRQLSPPRSVRADSESPNSDAFWSDFGKRSPHDSGLFPSMMGNMPQRLSATAIGAM
jgi:hypothetical protein